MSTPEVQEAATKQRIIKHMNADHHDSIRRYLEAYSNKSPFQTRNAQMTDIGLTDMKFTCNNEQHTIPFTPPMTSLRDARDRVVQLDKDALRILGRSDLSVNTYIPPTTHPLHLFNFTACLLSYLFLPFPSIWQPGSLLYDTVLYRVPGFANFVAWAGWWIVVAFMIPIHSVEAGIMARRLRIKHGLTPVEGVWWAWTGSMFIEGVTAKLRLDGLLEGKRREKDTKKH